MKFGALNCPRSKSDGKYRVQMRRMSKSSPGCENGSKTSDLATASSSLSIAKSDGGPLTVSTQSQENVDKTAIPAPIGEKIENMSVESVGDNIQQILKQVKAGNQEAAHLKEMLILHLGMIQHQQQLLLAKDRLIRTLAAEKDALKCRLERMERRMSLLKQKGDGSHAPLPSDIPGVTPENTLHLRVQEKPSSQSPDKNFKVNRRKPGDQRLPRGSLNTSNRDQSTPSKNRNKAVVNNVLKNKVKRRLESGEEGVASPSRDLDLRSKQPVTTPIKAEKYDAAADASAINQTTFRIKPLKRKFEEIGNSSIVKTDKPFYVPCQTDVELAVATKVPEKAEAQSPTRKKRPRVEVPKWRFHPVSNCYSLEGTENMEDEVYVKRHQKTENDEKRRKRWDIQRIREQRMYEKLKYGRYAASSPPKSKKHEIVTSFCPALDAAKFIEVAEDIPVNVFGYPLILKKNNEFSLPWFDISQREKEEKKEREEKQRQQQLSRFRKR